MKIDTGSNLASIIISLSNEFRSPEFVSSRDYMLNRLPKGHSPEIGIVSLPEKTRERVLRVGGLFDDIGKLVAFRVIDERIVICSVGPTVIRTWKQLGHTSTGNAK
jgi:hypothetical protein